ncbi:MAG: hypothetical protein KKF48_03645 [Nanoarchaeota archaeon]|nr:hypothetical protein [Nanoarchaeota archaeon]MBU1028113.1 hypothetical protein [Nanoarchaeota archaeon]
MNINFEEINREVEKNFKERLNFIKIWAEYVKTHSDEDWSEQQNILINSQFNQ